MIGVVAARAQLDLVFRGAQLRGGGREAVPYLARVDDFDALRQQLARGLDPIDRDELVEVNLQHLAAELHAHRQVGGELQARARARGVRL